MIWYCHKVCGVAYCGEYRVKTRDGKMRGGAMYAIENGVSKKTGINFKWVAVLFAVFALFASFGVGCGVQTNAIAKIMDTTFNPDKNLYAPLLRNGYFDCCAYFGCCNCNLRCSCYFRRY